MIRKILISLLMAMLLVLACDKEYDRIIPYVPVHFAIDLNIANDLTVTGNSMVFPGGYGGVIIYCEVPYEIYYAYDGACTYDYISGCRIGNQGVVGTCSCCGSEFLLMGGAYPSRGPASFPLQQCHVSVVRNTLQVYN